MVAPSKLFVHPLSSYHCSQTILHPGIGCFRYFLNNLFIHCIGGLKYFAPLLVVPLVLKYKSMNRELFVQIVKHYLQTVLGGSLATASTFLFVCCLRNLLGNFRTYTTLFVPTVIGLQVSWFFPKRVLKLFTTATSQATLEGLLLQYSNKFTYLILHSPMVQTILFMLNSAIVLHYKRYNVYKDFWFIQPHEKCEKAKTNQEQESNGTKNYYEKCKKVCDHTNISCAKFLLDGMISHIFYGIALDLLSMLMKGNLTQKTQGFMRKAIGKLKTFRPYMTAFFLSYVGIYRLSSCLLRKYYSHLSLDLQHILSAFLGGFSFIFVKRVNFISLSLVISTQILWQQFCTSIRVTESGRKPNLVLMMLKKAPISPMIFSINGGYLIHNYILNYRLINSLARGFLDGITHNNTKNIRNFIINNNLKSLIEMAGKYSVKTFL